MHAIDLALIPEAIKPRVEQLLELQALVEAPPPGVDVAADVEEYLAEANADVALAIAVLLASGIEPAIGSLAGEARRLSARKKALVEQRKRLRQTLVEVMRRLDLRRLDGPTVSVTRRAGAWRVEVDQAVDVELLEARFVRRPPPEPDLEAIAKALESGEIVPGFRLVQGGEGVQIR